MIDRIPYWKILEGALFHFDKRRPLAFATFKVLGLERLDRLAPAMKVLARSRRQMGVHLDALEQQLRDGGGPWILGESFSLADVSWLVIFERLVQADVLHVFVDEAEPARVRRLLGPAAEPPELSQRRSSSTRTRPWPAARSGCGRSRRLMLGCELRWRVRGLIERRLFRRSCGKRSSS